MEFKTNVDFSRHNTFIGLSPDLILSNREQMLANRYLGWAISRLLRPKSLSIIFASCYLLRYIFTTESSLVLIYETMVKIDSNSVSLTPSQNVKRSILFVNISSSRRAAKQRHAKFGIALEQ